MKIPFCKPSIDKNDIDGVVKVLKSGWLAMGEKTVEFEKQFAKYVGCKHAIAVNSCTSALFLCLKALGIKKGDEVITSALTFAATANVIIHCGAKPVLVDVDMTGCMNVQLIEKVVTKRTRAIIPVHYGGNVCNMECIEAIAKKHNLFIVEDAAHAVGAGYNEVEKVGSRNLTCFSFYPTKNMTCAEGGMITTNDDFLAGKLMLLRMHGMDRDAWKRYSHKGNWDYDILVNGFKMNMNDMQASLGLSQLEKLDWMNLQRMNRAYIYDSMLKQEFSKNNANKVWHIFWVFVKKRNQLMKYLNDRGIGTSVFFKTINRHKAFKHLKGFFPISDYFYNHSLCLPLYPDLSQKQVKFICASINKFNNTWHGTVE